MPDSGSATTLDRLLASAVELFAQFGYHGVSTRDIARKAEINEVTVYRHYANKRELFIAAVESELAKVRIRPELLTKLAAARDPQSAVRAVFLLIADAVHAQPQLVRLLNFSAMEFGSALEPLYRKHLEGLLTIAASYLEPWTERGYLSAVDTRTIVLAFAATMVCVQCFYPVFATDNPFSPTEETASMFAKIWHTALANHGVPS